MAGWDLLLIWTNNNKKQWAVSCVPWPWWQPLLPSLIVFSNSWARIFIFHVPKWEGLQKKCGRVIAALIFQWSVISFERCKESFQYSQRNLGYSQTRWNCSILQNGSSRSERLNKHNMAELWSGGKNPPLPFPIKSRRENVFDRKEVFGGVSVSPCAVFRR